MNPDGSLSWMAAVSFTPLMKSLSIDSAEQYVYFGSNTNPLDVLRLSTSSGWIFDSKRL